MDNRNPLFIAASRAVALLLVVGSGAVYAQVPVDEQGNPVGTSQWDGNTSDKVVASEEFELLDASALQELVGPVALYPDDLLAIVLPAATYPLQVVQASRFLEKLKTDPSLKPDEDWDDSIVALVNYPEVVEMMNEDLDWTWRLGEAVVAQQNDVLNAVEDFRDKAYAAGNLKSDEYQTVSRNDDVIEITPVSEEVIYVPYYEPQSVVVYQSRPVYYYYPRAYPVYYYPYPASYAFSSGYFWGVTTAFTIGWSSNHLRVYHQSYYGHPYYGHNYRNHWWYRSPAIGRYNSIYIDNSVNINTTVVNNRYSQGDVWRPGRNARLRYDDQRITRNRYYANGQPARSSISAGRNTTSGSNAVRTTDSQRSVSRAAIERNNSVRDMRENITRNRETRAPSTRTQNTTRSPSATERQVRQPGATSPAVRANSNDSVRQMRETISSNQAQRERVTSTRQPAVATQPRTRDTSRTTTPQTRSPATQRAPTTQRSTIPSSRAPTTQRSTIPSSRAPITTSRPATVQRSTVPSTRAPAVQQRSSAPVRETRTAPAAQTRAPSSRKTTSSSQSSRSGNSNRRNSSQATRKR